MGLLPRCHQQGYRPSRRQEPSRGEGVGRGGQVEQFPVPIPFQKLIQTLHQAILCGLVVSGDVFHVGAHQNEQLRPARSKPSNRQRFSRSDHAIRLLVFYLTDMSHGMRHVPRY